MDDSARLASGQTIIFVGDHTSPDNPGYVRIVNDILVRFHPRLRVNLISAGARGQTAHGLRSHALLDILSSSRPDWLAIGLGMADAMREPELGSLLEAYDRRAASAREDDATIGPEYRTTLQDLGPVSDIGRMPEPNWRNLPAFTDDIGHTCLEMESAGVRCILITPVLVGDDLANPLNLALRAYSEAIRGIARVRGAVLVDVHRACRDLFDRAGSYKQKVALAGPTGQINPQGEALIARAFLQALGLLPYPAFRPPR